MSVEPRYRRVLNFDGNGNPIDLNAYDTLIDVASATVTYVGKCVPGSLTSAAVWQIKKIDSTANPSLILWADGDKKFDNIWNNRATLTYNTY